MSNTERFDDDNYEFNTNSKNGVYLIHGFTNTTYEIKKLAQYLSEKDIVQLLIISLATVQLLKSVIEPNIGIG